MSESNIFTATSHSGDFSEALRGAIAEANRQLNTLYFRWSLENVQGTVGGFMNARNITVSIKATAPGRIVHGVMPDSPEAFHAERDAVGHDLCGDWHAWHDRMPGKRATLHVVGRCVFPTGGYAVSLELAEPQGINPRIYLLDLIVVPPTGPVTQVVTEVPVHYREVTDAVYSHVQILPENAVVPVQEVS